MGNHKEHGDIILEKHLSQKALSMQQMKSSPIFCGNEEQDKISFPLFQALGFTLFLGQSHLLCFLAEFGGPNGSNLPRVLTPGWLPSLIFQGHSSRSGSEGCYSGMLSEAPSGTS